MTTSLATLAEKPKSELVQGFHRLQASIAKHKEKVAKGSEALLDTALTMGGGAAFALVEKYGPNKQYIADIDNAALLGAALSLAGALGYLGKASEQLAEVGNGMLAVEAYMRVKKSLSK